MTPVLDRRALNRATLARQSLLSRSEMTVLQAVQHLVGLQAQTPHSWYLGFWSRLADFTPEQTAEPLADRRLVRIALMRSTIHLVTPGDAEVLRPLIQPVLDRDLYHNHTHGKPIANIDMAALITVGADLLYEKPRTNKELGLLLGERWPECTPASLVYAVRNQVPLVQVPPRGVWGRSGAIAHTTLRAWRGTGPTSTLSLDEMVLRYLTAFGPATVQDVQTWSGLTRLREVIDRLRPRLTTFRDERDRELFDLPDAPRPDAETPAPPRFLYDYDNLLLSHADRSRVITDDHARLNYRAQRPTPQLLLVDGFTAADWTITRDADTATMTIRPFRRPFAASDTATITDEATRLLAFTDPAATSRTVVFGDPI
ncbi:winged helix DNA-binding domain-containing protein [Nocardia sp. NPDC059229]|uniref:winged helix DNA-binding domain-containing protein n=1 Tax=Nocardia sp. NPDC059229 TaxID=3346778 RepID=UPI0036D036C2